MPRVLIATQAWGVVQGREGEARAGVPVQLTDLNGAVADVFTTEDGSTDETLLTNTRGEIPGWAEDGSYDLTIAGVTRRVELVSARVRNITVTGGQFVSVTDAAFGATGDGVTNDSEAIQAAFDAVAAAWGGTIYFPAGTYKVLAAVAIPTDVPVKVVGDGIDTTTIHCPNDLGSGTCALTVDDTDALFTTGTHVIEDMTVAGPQETTTKGEMPADMDGVLVRNSFILNRVKVTGFRAGFLINGDHQYLTDCGSQNNYFNVYFDPDAQTTGDQSFTRCKLDGPLFASLAVGHQAIITGATFAGTHFGFGPYGIWLEGQVDGGPALRQGAMDTVTFVDCGFEQFGNGIFYDEDLARECNGVTFVGCDSATNPFSDFDNIAARDQDYAFRCALGSVTIVGRTGFLQTPGDVGIIEGTSLEFNWEYATNAIAACVAATKYLFAPSTGGDKKLGGGGATEWWVPPLGVGASIERGDVVGLGASLAPATTQMPAGVAAFDLEPGDIPVLQVGRRADVNTVAGGVGTFRYVKLAGAGDPGKITDATSATDGIVVGYSLFGGAGRVETFLKLG